MAVPKLLKASEVCEIAQVQPYVLRSWEKEFPGIGVQKQADGPRLYRPSDIDQVLRLKQLVFGEGLTLAGARRRLDEGAGEVGTAEFDSEMADAAVGSDPSPMLDDVLRYEARQRIGQVRAGLKSILDMLSGGAASPPEVFDLRPPVASEPPAKVRTVTTSPGRDGGTRGAGSKRKRAST